MFRLYLRRWRLAVLAVLAGIGSAAAVLVISGPLAGHAANTGQPLTGPAGSYPAGRLPSGSDRTPLAVHGLRLLGQAASASQDLSYRGVQMVAWFRGGTVSSYLINLWHRPGAPAISQEAGPGNANETGYPGPDVGDSSALAITPTTLRLIKANFVVAYQGRGAAASRPADIVRLTSASGALAARFWVDRATRLPLRREMYDAAGKVVNADAYIVLTVGSRDLGAPPVVQAAEPRAAVSGSGIGALRRRGWPVPASLGGGQLAQVGATTWHTSSGDVLDVAYSDGLSVVSLFLERGDLPGQLDGWQVYVVNGHPVYVGDPDRRSFAWAAGGYVFTVIADAPPQTVQLVVADLPHDPELGFMQRVRRGLARILSWVDPFG